MEQPEFVLNGSNETLVFLPECQADGKPGSPRTLVSQVSVGVPDGSNVKVQVLSVESEVLNNFNLAPNPVLETSDQTLLGGYNFIKDQSLYGQTGFLPAVAAELGAVDRLRQFRIATIRIYPLQYDPLGAVLRMNRRVLLKVSWDISGKTTEALPDEPFDPVYSKLMINYRQCRDWRITSKAAKTKSADPFEGYSVWYKLSVLQEGIYRLDYNYLLRNGIDPAAIDPRTIKLFSGGSAALPKDRNANVSDTMAQVAILVRGQEDGRFDPGDYILFYGQDLSGWSKNSGLATPQFFNPYTDTNRYWLTWGGDAGLRMQIRNCEPGAENITPLQSYTDTVHFEQDKFNPFFSGELYYWENMRRAKTEEMRSYTFNICTSGNESGSGKIFIMLRAGARSKHRMFWGSNGLNQKEIYWVGGPNDITSANPYNPYEMFDSISVSNLQPDNNAITVDLIKENADSSESIYLNWVEVVYLRRFQANKGSLKFRADSTGQKTCRFYLTGFNDDTCAIWDITDPGNPKSLATSRVYPAYVQFDDAWYSANRYFASAASAWLNPCKMEHYIPNNLRQSYSNVKYLIIAADQLWLPAQALLNHHRAKPEQQPSMAVKLSWIYNEFGFGLNDPAAIRNFLKYIYINSGGTSPVWCVLFGNGNCDYRHIDRSIPNGNLVPTHQEDYLNYVIKEYQFHSYDDWYAYFTTGLYPQFAIARLPAANLEEAWNIVNKTIRYDSPASYGDWRTKTVMVADDLSPDGSIYMNYAENLCRRLPDYYTAEKVYGAQYPEDNFGRKPEARNELLRLWNVGAGIVNYSGHGAWYTWGDEWYFLDTYVPYLNNGERLPFLITASCGISRFDNPYNKCINSLVVTKQSGGAIASFGSTRESGGYYNDVLNVNLYSSIFNLDYDLGRAVLQAKCLYPYPSNNQCYVLLGDPGIGFAKPQAPMDIAVDTDTLHNFGRYHIYGSVNSGEGDFSGTIMLEVRDVPHLNTDFNYRLPGDVIFKGKMKVLRDSFNVTVNMPWLRTYADSTGFAKIKGYAWNSATDAAAVINDSIWVGGDITDTTAAYQDTSAPKITLYTGGYPVMSGDYLSTNTKFVVVISDRSGVSIVPGMSNYGKIKFGIYKEGRQLVSDDISGNFIYDISNDTLTSGSAGYDYTFGSGGIYQIKIEAYDTRTNKGVWEGEVNVETTMRVYSVYNYPNPTNAGTRFTFMLSQPGKVDIRIFTVAGNEIKTISSRNLPAGYNQVYWDGRDDRGSVLSNGVYVYMVTVKEEGEESREYGKLVIMR
jgi:hypothetical protein